MSRRALAIALAVAVLLGLAAGLFFSCFERRSVERVVGGSEAARRNPFLAAERLLAALGSEVRSFDGPYALDALPPPDATLLFTPQRRTVSAERQAELRRWVEAGGHLVVEAWELWDDEDRRPDLLLDPLGFETVQEIAEPPAADSVEEVVEAVLEGWKAPDLSSLPVPNRDAPLAVEFDGNFRWDYVGESPTRLRATGEAGDHLITIELGRGLLTAVTDGSFLRNDAIGDHDHAEALVRLVRLGGREGPVWVVTGEHWPGLLGPLFRHGRPALAAGALWLAAFVWRSARRRGPLRPPPPRERRSWLEHLDAVGRYHWRLDRGRSLREADRAILLRELERAHPGWLQRTPESRNALLAAASGLSHDEVARALASPTEDREARFVEAIRTMERIRNP